MTSHDALLLIKQENPHTIFSAFFNVFVVMKKRKEKVKLLLTWLSLLLELCNPSLCESRWIWGYQTVQDSTAHHILIVVILPSIVQNLIKQQIKPKLLMEYPLKIWIFLCSSQLFFFFFCSCTFFLDKCFCTLNWL